MNESDNSQQIEEDTEEEISASVERIDCYNNVLSDLREQHDNIVDPRDQSLDQKLNAVEKLRSRSKQGKSCSMTEISCDGRAMKLIANLGQQKALALSATTSKFDVVEYAAKIRNCLMGEDENVTAEKMASFGRDCQKYLRWGGVPRWQIMFGALERGEVKRKPPKERKSRIADNETAKKTKPEKLSNFNGANEDDATTAEVTSIFSALRRYYKDNPRDELLYWNFVLDPHSFGLTIENVFHVSFLVRDGRVSLTGDDDHIIIKPLPKPVGGERGHVERRQQYVNLSIERWQKLVNKFCVTTAMLKRIRRM